MAVAVSRRKQMFSWAASSELRGGTRRVLTCPARGALVITASAQIFLPTVTLVAGSRRRWLDCILAELLALSPSHKPRIGNVRPSRFERISRAVGGTVLRMLQPPARSPFWARGSRSLSELD